MFRYLAFVIFLVCFPALLISETLVTVDGQLFECRGNGKGIRRIFVTNLKAGKVRQTTSRPGRTILQVYLSVIESEQFS